MPTLRLALALVSAAALLAACGGDDLEAASEELREMEQRVEQARARVGSREADARAADDALREAREALDRAEEKLRSARERVAKQVDDAKLFRAVQKRLLDDARLRDVAISARVQQQVVTLEGEVATPQQKQRAEEIAARTTGVETVINQIEVRAAEE